jgi:hypothetical protein
MRKVISPHVLSNINMIDEKTTTFESVTNRVSNNELKEVIHRE